MSEIRIMTNFNIELEFPAAPFHRRLLAWFIDMAVLVIYMILAGRLLDSMVKFAGTSASWAILMILLIPFLTYHLICEILMNGQSIGKKITGLRVVNENGGQPSIGQYIIRWLIRTSDYMVLIIILFAPMAAGTGNLDYLWKIGLAISLLVLDIILVNASKKNQRLGDMLAHTLVIRSSEKFTIEDTVFLNISNNYIPQFPQVMQLSDRDINSLKGILDTARKRHDYSLAEMA
ncbi:MAG TPA: RDD family protein, partial [Flavisolibacter sp.]|nr:RDD family protein [Flavisolibacter sp.]